MMQSSTVEDLHDVAMKKDNRQRNTTTAIKENFTITQKYKSPLWISAHNSPAVFKLKTKPLQIQLGSGTLSSHGY